MARAAHIARGDLPRVARGCGCGPGADPCCCHRAIGPRECAAIGVSVHRYPGRSNQARISGQLERPRRHCRLTKAFLLGSRGSSPRADATLHAAVSSNETARTVRRNSGNERAPFQRTHFATPRETMIARSSARSELPFLIKGIQRIGLLGAQSPGMCAARGAWPAKCETAAQRPTRWSRGSRRRR